MSLRLRLPLHGRSHLPQGGDPIRGIIAYLITNIGGWLDIIATGHGGSAGYGINIETNNTGDASNGIRIYSSQDVSLYAQTTAQMYGGTLLQLGVSGAGDPMLLDTNDGNIELSTGDGTATVDTASYLITLKVGGSFDVRDHTNSPLFRVDEDGDVHILTGGNIIADL